MININELRNDSKVFYDVDTYCTVVQVDGFNKKVGLAGFENMVNIKDIKPIKITPEILLMAGFEKQENEKSEWDSGEPYWHDRNIPMSAKFHFPGLVVRKGKYYLLSRTNPETKYFHQLQNLYQVLTGQELNLKFEMSGSNGI